MASEQMGFDRAELRQVYAALKAMGDAAKEEARTRIKRFSRVCSEEVYSRQRQYDRGTVASRY
jgi:hypothetical protein